MDIQLTHLPLLAVDPLLAVEIDGPYLIQLISRVLHILSAIILVGGLFYLRTILSPAATSSEKSGAEKIGEVCFADRRAVWAKWVGIATLFLLVSGIYNVMVIVGQVKESGGKLPPAYMILLLAKMLLAMLVMFIAAILAGKTEAADRFRNQMSKWLNIGWLASMTIVVIAAILRTLH